MRLQLLTAVLILSLILGGNVRLSNDTFLSSEAVWLTNSAQESAQMSMHGIPLPSWLNLTPTYHKTATLTLSA